MSKASYSNPPSVPTKSKDSNLISAPAHSKGNRYAQHIGHGLKRVNREMSELSIQQAKMVEERLEKAYSQSDANFSACDEFVSVHNAERKENVSRHDDAEDLWGSDMEEFYDDNWD